MVGKAAARLGLEPRVCAAIEDSPAGIQAGRDAGMKVLAVATSYGREHLTEAHRIVESLTEVTAGDLERLL